MVLRRLRQRVERSARGTDRGAATVEYTGMIMFIAILILSLLMLATPIGGTIAAKLCEAVGTTCGTSTTADRNAPPEEPCTLTEDGTQVDASATVWFVNVGADGEMMVEKMSDGTYRVTVGGDLGVSAAVSAGELYGSMQVGDVGTAGGGQAGVSAGVSGGAGVEYTFTSKDDADEFTDFVTRSVVKSGVASASNAILPGSGVGATVAGWLWDKVTGYDYSPPAPDASYYQGGIVLSGSAGVGDLISSADASLDYSDAVGFRLDHETGEKTIYTRTTISGDAAFQLGLSSTDANLGLGAGGSADAEAMVATTIDKDNKVIKVSLDAAATAEGATNVLALSGQPLQSGGKGVHFSASMTVNDANRTAVLLSLASLAGDTATGHSVTAKAKAAQWIIAGAREDGDVTARFVDVSSQNLFSIAAGAKVPVLGGVDGGFGLGTTSEQTTDAQYLTDYGWKDWAACAA